MLPVAHPEVLTVDYLPPVPIARRAEVDRLVAALTSERARTHGGIAMVRGPSGSGTSTVARLAARAVAETFRHESPPKPMVVATVRVRWCSGALAVAAALLHNLDETFRPRGFPVAELLAGFLRRLQRSGRGAVVVLDDLGPGAPDLGPVLRALRAPKRFLPEGDDRLLTITVILAGRPDAVKVWETARRCGEELSATIELNPYTSRELSAIISDRACRAFGREPPMELVDRLLRQAAREGRGTSSLMERLRRDTLGNNAPGMRPVDPTSGEVEPLRVEGHVLRALERVALGARAPLAEVRHWASVFAREEGVRPLPTTTLWRRIVRLETSGWLRRDVRTGGPGGTSSMIELLRPIAESPAARWELSTPRGSDGPSPP